MSLIGRNKRAGIRGTEPQCAPSACIASKGHWLQPVKVIQATVLLRLGIHGYLPADLVDTDVQALVTSTFGTSPDQRWNQKSIAIIQSARET